VPELVVFTGLPGSGKSSFYRERFATTHTLVSKDLLRNNRNPSRRQRQLVEQALAVGHGVVVDNTNPSRADRAELIALGKAAGARIVGYLFTSEAPACLERNQLREGKARVPAVAIFTAARRLERPTLDEGFDALYTVALDADGFHVDLAGAAG
jgi:predicted kinase